MKNQFIVIETTTSRLATAKKIANILLKNHLAGCIQLNPITSFYHWNNKINCDQEILLKIKTRSSNFKKICELIKQNHQYEIPQIISYKLEKTDDKYQSWLNSKIS